MCFFCNRLILPPRGEFLLVVKGRCQLRPDIIRSNSGSQALTKVSTWVQPSQNCVFEGQSYQSHLRFDIRFWNRPVQKREGPATADIQWRTAGKSFRRYTGTGGDREAGLQRAGAKLSWPEVGLFFFCGFFFSFSVNSLLCSFRSQSG